MYDCQVRARCAEEAERGQSGILEAAIGGSYKAAGRRGLPICDLRFAIWKFARLWRGRAEPDRGVDREATIGRS